MKIVLDKDSDCNLTLGDILKVVSYGYRNVSPIVGLIENELVFTVVKVVKDQGGNSDTTDANY